MTQRPKEILPFDTDIDIAKDSWIQQLQQHNNINIELIQYQINRNIFVKTSYIGDHQSLTCHSTHHVSTAH